MNKDSIYQIIGYQGEYNNNVKKAIRKLLKENHPDNHGDANIFKIINEVKKELETNKVSYQYKDNKKNNINDIDYDFCHKMIDKIENELIIINKEFIKTKKEINNVDTLYSDLYENNLKNANILLNIEKKKKELNKIKVISIAITLLLVITFIVMFITKNNYILIILSLLIIILIYEIIKFFKIINKITMHDEIELKKYLNIIDDIKKNQCLKKEYENKLLKILEEKGKLENNLRFYNNLLNNR